MVSAKPIVLICPKCGYDQRGEISRWESVCPMEGRCPECGLGFLWRDIFDPVRNELGWYVEHTHSVLGIFGRTPGTLMRLVIPYVYWRTVGVEKSIRLRVLAIWLIVFWVVLHLVLSIPYGMGVWSGMSSQFYGSIGELYGQAGVKGLLVPIVNAVGWPWFDAWADYRNGSVHFGASWTRQGVVLKDYLTPMVPLFGMSLLWVVVLLATPITRRRAKIRSAHVARAALISMVPVILAYELARLVEGLDDWMRIGNTVSNDWARGFGAVVMPALVLWMLVFWALAVKVGWKVRPCGVLIFLGSIASLLGGVAMLYVVSMLFGWY